jgi:hypothetical protein
VEAKSNTVLDKNKDQQNGSKPEPVLLAEYVQVAMALSKEQEMDFADTDRDHVRGQVCIKAVKELRLTVIHSLVVAVPPPSMGPVCSALMITLCFVLVLLNIVASCNLLAHLSWRPTVQTIRKPDMRTNGMEHLLQTIVYATCKKMRAIWRFTNP